MAFPVTMRPSTDVCPITTPKSTAAITKYDSRSARFRVTSATRLISRGLFFIAGGADATKYFLKRECDYSSASAQNMRNRAQVDRSDREMVHFGEESGIPCGFTFKLIGRGVYVL